MRRKELCENLYIYLQALSLSLFYLTPSAPIVPCILWGGFLRWRFASINKLSLSCCPCLWTIQIKIINWNDFQFNWTNWNVSGACKENMQLFSFSCCPISQYCVGVCANKRILKYFLPHSYSFALKLMVCSVRFIVLINCCCCLVPKIRKLVETFCFGC